MNKPAQEKSYQMLTGIIECRCGGWHMIKTFWTGSDLHGWDCHTSVIKCHKCGAVIFCNVCRKDDYCTIHGKIETSDPTQTEMRQL